MRTSRWYVLDDSGNPVPVPDLETWARQMEAINRHIADTQIGEVRVSTVFLGLDHSWFHDGPPLLFETLVFEGPMDGEMERYSTRQEALAGHEAMCARVRGTLN